MKPLKTLAAGAAMLAASTTWAAPVTLTFEDQTSFASLSYAGQPFRASGDLLALANDDLGPYFSNNPSGRLVMFATTPADGGRAEFTAGGGFLNSVSFFYAASQASTVAIRNALGGVLAQFNLLANSTSAEAPFSTWTFASLAFTGVAASIDFTATAGVAAFDNLTFTVPEPASVLLLALGLGGIGFATGRRRAA